MAVVKKNNLARFVRKVSKYQGKINGGEIAEFIGDVGVSVAKEEYSGKNVDVGAEVGRGTARIVARGDKIAYMEFGTGVTGKNTYDGQLPTQKLVFESPKGVKQSTEGWQYNYRKEQGKTDKDWIGHRAEAQMFKTSQRLKAELPEKIKQKIKGDK